MDPEIVDVAHTWRMHRGCVASVGKLESTTQDAGLSLAASAAVVSKSVVAVRSSAKSAVRLAPNSDLFTPAMEPSMDLPFFLSCSMDFPFFLSCSCLVARKKNAREKSLNGISDQTKQQKPQNELCACCNTSPEVSHLRRSS